MSIADAPSSSSRASLRPLDADLPMLASQAAIELDGLILGHQQPLAAAAQLASRLQQSIPDDRSPLPKSLASPAFSLLSEAMVRGGVTDQPPTSVDELIREASRIARQLRGPEDPGDSDKSRLRQLRDFCIALSRCSAAYQRSIHELRPPHPFRR